MSFLFPLNVSAKYVFNKYVDKTVYKLIYQCKTVDHRRCSLPVYTGRSWLSETCGL